MSYCVQSKAPCLGNSNINSSIPKNSLTDTDWVIASPKKNKRPPTKSFRPSPLNKHPNTVAFSQH